MTDWRIVACKQPGCHSLAFSVRRNPWTREVNVICEACGASFLTVFDTEGDVWRAPRDAAPGRQP